jgi:predicted PurR-regulated permease PerM
VGKHVTAFMFTAIITAFVLAPLVFALWSLLSESHVLFRQIAGADERGIVLPQWLQGLPLLGSWQGDLSSPGALLGWTHRANATAFLGVLQSLGQFAARHLLILLFTILLLFFLYDQGESLARDLRRWLRQGIGEQAERHVDVVTRAVRASVNSMLAVGLFDGFATGCRTPSPACHERRSGAPSSARSRRSRSSAMRSSLHWRCGSRSRARPHWRSSCSRSAGRSCWLATR